MKFQLTILLASSTQMPPLEDVDVFSEIFKYDGPTDEFSAADIRHFAKSQISASQKLEGLYRFRTSGTLTERAVAAALKADTIDKLADEVGVDDPYEEIFRVPVGEPLPRVRFLAMVLPRAIVPAPSNPLPSTSSNEETDTVAQLNADFARHRKHIASAPSPSVAAKSVNYNNFQAGAEPLLDGRFSADGPPTPAPPIELYHSCFAAYKRLSEDLSVAIPEAFVRQVAQLMRELSTIRTAEINRDFDVRQKLAAVLGVGLEKIAASGSNPDFTSASPTLLNINGAPVIVELKAELGQGGNEPSVQVSFSYAKFHCANERSGLLTESNCPSFLVGLAGAWLVVLGAVTTSKTIIQRLSPYEWFGCSKVIDDHQIMSLSRHLFALRTCIHSLKQHYATLNRAVVSADCVHPRFCPSITSYTDVAGNQIVFEYMKPLQVDPTCVIFLARRTDSGERIVVKFVNRYSVEAHECLAAARYAPRFIRHQPLGEGYGDLAIVVMGYVVGKTLHEIYGADGEIDTEVYDAIQDAMDHLEQNNLIMADLRRPNIMLADGPGDAKQRLRIIDFDWACNEASGARYPCHLSSDVRKRASAEEYETITREHQNNMLQNL